MADPIDQSGQALNFLSKLNKMVIPKMKKFGDAFDRLSMSLRKKPSFGDSWEEVAKLNKEFAKGSEQLKGMSSNINEVGKQSEKSVSYLRRIDDALKGITTMSAINIWQNLGKTETVGTAQQEVLGLHDALYQLSLDGPEQLKDLRSAVFATGRAFVREGIPVMPNEIADAMTSVVDAGIRGTKSITHYAKEVVLAGKAFNISSDEAAEFFYTTEEAWQLGVDAGKRFASVAFEISKNFNISANEVISAMNELSDEFDGIMLALPDTAKKQMLQGASTVVAMAKSIFMDSGNELVQSMTKFITDPAEAMNTLGRPLSHVGIGFEQARSMVEQGRLDELFVKVAEGMSKMDENMPTHAIAKLAEKAGVTFTQWMQMSKAFDRGELSMEKVKLTTVELNKTWDDANTLHDRANFIFSRLTQSLEKVKSALMNYGGAVVDVSGEALEALTTFGMAVAPMVFVAKEMGFSLEKTGEKLKGLKGRLFGASNTTDELAASLRESTKVSETGTEKLKAYIVQSKLYTAASEKMAWANTKLSAARDAASNLITKSVTAIKGSTTWKIAATVATVGLTVATWALNTALAVLTSPITLVIGGLALLTAGVVAVMMHWDKLGKAMADGMNWMSDLGERAIKFLDTLPDRIISFLDDIPQFIESAITGTGDMAETGFTKAFRRLMPILGKLTLKLIKFALYDMPFRVLPKLIGTLFSSAGKLIGFGLGKLFFDIILPFFQNQISLIWDYWKAMLWDNPIGLIKSIASAVLGALTDFFKQTKDVTAEAAVTTARFFVAIPGKIIDAFKSAGSAIFDVITWPHRKARDFISGIFNVSSLGTRMKDGLKDSLSSVFEIVTSPFQAAWTWLFGNTLYDFTVIPKKINEISQIIVASITAPFRAAFDVVVSIWENIEPIVKRAIEGLWDIMPWFIKKPIEYLFKNETTEVKKVEKVEAKKEKPEVSETAVVLSMEMEKLLTAVRLQTDSIVRAIYDTAPKDEETTLEKSLKLGPGGTKGLLGLADFWQRGGV